MAVWFLLLTALGSLIVGVLTVAGWLWIKRPRTSIPGPPTLPLLGNALQFYKLPVLLDRLGDLHKRYGDIFRLYVGHKLLIVVTQPEDVRKVLATTRMRERDPHFIRLSQPILGNGLITSSGEVWRAHRKLIEQAFRAEVLEKYMDSFNYAGQCICDKLLASGGAEVDLYPVLSMTMLGVVVSTVFGVDFELVEPDAHKRAELPTEINNFVKGFSLRIFRPWLSIDLILRMTKVGRELQRQVKLVRNLMERGIALLTENQDAIISSGRSPFVNILLNKSTEVPWSHDEKYDEVVTLAASGTETSSTTVGFALALLGLYPSWQDLAHRELDDVFGSGDDYLRPATSDDIPKLVVLDAIIKETLRLFPAITLLPHLATEDTPLADGRYVAPLGSCVLVPLFLMHRHPELFPQPDEFNPGRFLPGGSANSRKNGSYLPFGAGSRKCVGSRFADLEMKVVLAMVLRRFRILPGSSREEIEEITLSFVAHPITGYRVSCIPRQNIPTNS